MSEEYKDMLTPDYDDPFKDAEDDNEQEQAPQRNGKKRKPKAKRQNYLTLILNNQTPKEKASLILATGVLMVLTLYILAIIMTKTYYWGLPYKVKLDYDPLSLLMALISTGAGRFIMTFLLTVAIVYVIINNMLRKKALAEEGNIIRSKNSTYGDSDWLQNDPDTFEETFEFVPVKNGKCNPVNIPLAIVNNRLCCIPEKPKHTQFKNQNIAIVGGSGSGKSYTAIEPILLNRIAYKQSFLATDTKGALYRDYAAICKEKGYNVKVFNTTSFPNSDGWDCLKDIVQAHPEKVNDYIDNYATTIIKNTLEDDSAKVDAFWEPNQKDLLRILLHLVCRSEQYEGHRKLEDLIRLVNSPLETILNKLNNLKPYESAYNASMSFRSTKSETVQDQIRQGLANRLQILRTADVAACLSADEIDFADAIRKPTAIFLVTSDNSPGYDAVTSLFVACMYSKIIEISDSEKYDGSLFRPFWFIIDEICNMAAIQDFSRKISTNRSRKANFCFAIQSLSQMDTKYKKMCGNILSNCGTMMFLGCNDTVTAEYISKRAGTFTQIIKATTEEKPRFFQRFHITLQQNVRIQEAPKNLIEISDADQFESGKIVVFISGKRPLKGKTFTAAMHPLYDYSVKSSLHDRHVEWYEEFKRQNPELASETKPVYEPSEHELGSQKPDYSLPKGYQKNPDPQEPVIQYILDNSPEARMQDNEARNQFYAQLKNAKSETAVYAPQEGYIIDGDAVTEDLTLESLQEKVAANIVDPEPPASIVNKTEQTGELTEKNNEISEEDYEGFY